MKTPSILLLLPALGLAFAAQAQTTTFTYQGRLADSGQPANGTYDFVFQLWDAPTTGQLVAPIVVKDDVEIDHGLFTVELDFGMSFDGSVRYLLIGLRPGLATEGYTALHPRQPITAVPHAITADSLTSVLPASQFAGTYSGAVTLNNAANSLSGRGSGLTALNASELTSGTVPDARLAANVARTDQVWLLGGNAGTTPGTHFVGTIDGQPLELRVNSQRALRLEPTDNNSVNVIGGWEGNHVGPDVVGATIGGGGTGDLVGTAHTNRVLGSFGTVGGGLNNSASAGYSTVSGGAQNISAGQYAAVGGGIGNITIGYAATVGGGQNNSANDVAATVGGGVQNTAGNPSTTVAGGQGNTASALNATVGGGAENTASEFNATVGGGLQNSASGRSAIVGGGWNNTAIGFYVLWCWILEISFQERSGGWRSGCALMAAVSLL